MNIEFDPDKSAKNDKERGLPFQRVPELDWDRAVIVPDHRKDYGEERLLAFARMQGRLHVVCFSVRDDTFRIISFRKANKEEKTYAEAPVNR